MTIEMDLNDVRRDYESHGITRKEMDPDPFVQFGRWLQRARDLELLDATAMTLATADGDGRPSARIVLLKHFDADGFCWYTDSRSRKGDEIEANPQAELLFHWRDLSRQVLQRRGIVPVGRNRWTLQPGRRSVAPARGLSGR
jgi:pyridoxamine 5'-phosphate oxidase